MRFVYIHGFNSGATSRSAMELRKLLPYRVIAPAPDYAMPFSYNLQKISAEIVRESQGDSFILAGSSLGAFYAAQVRLARIHKLVLWNPVIYPAMQLARFTGKNVRFTDQVEWDFSREALLSYAQAPDPRQWNNFNFPQFQEHPDRQVILGDADELLDSRLAEAFWRDHAKVSYIRSGHSIQDYSHILSFI